MVKDRLVVITGASRGIGAAAAQVFAAAGARVALLARDADALAGVAGGIGPAARAFPCDVARWDEVAGAVAAAEATLGPVRVMVNNAGVIDPIATIATSDPAAWDGAIDVTLKGVYHGMRAVLPGMIARGGGTILTVGSGAAYRPLEGWSAYCTAKAGALMLTRAAHLEASGAGVRAISLSPGTVATDMQARIRQSGVNPVSQLDWAEHIPPDWPARALLWMCGPEADAFLGEEVSLRDPAIRARIGLGGSW